MSRVAICLLAVVSLVGCAVQPGDPGDGAGNPAASQHAFQTGSGATIARSPKDHPEPAPWGNPLVQSGSNGETVNDPALRGVIDVSPMSGTSTGGPQGSTEATTDRPIPGVELEDDTASLRR